MRIRFGVAAVMLFGFLMGCSDVEPVGSGLDGEGTSELTDEENEIQDDDSSATDTSTDAEESSEEQEDTQNGTSVDGDTTESGMDCDDTTLFVLKPDDSQVANVMLVVDRSGSMSMSGEWERMVPVLTQMTDALQGMVDFGLMLFPNAGIDACAVGDVLVDPAPNSATLIAQALGQWSPLGGTPTSDSLQIAGDFLNTNFSGQSNYIVLATDGGPGCNTSLNGATCECIPDANCLVTSQNCLDSVRTANTVLTLRESGIKTFVIGIPGSETVSDVLDILAISGGTDVNGAHYAVTNETELQEALARTSGSLVPCDYELESALGTTDTLNVWVDGESVPQDPGHSNGWDSADGMIFTLYGEWCERLRDGLPHRVEARLNCE